MTGLRLRDTPGFCQNALGKPHADSGQSLGPIHITPRLKEIVAQAQNRGGHTNCCLFTTEAAARMAWDCSGRADAGCI